MDLAAGQNAFMVLVLPSMFGLSLVAEGIWKVMHQHMMGFVSIIMGLFFVAAVGVGWLFISGIL